jgi:putative hydrolase of the HAD superfamily
MSYQHLFFDLDHTLWDFETNSEEALLELYAAHDLEQQTRTTAPHFLKVYYRVNDAMWSLYRQGKVTKKQLRHQRFVDSFQQIGFTDLKAILKFEEEYIALAPTKTALMPGCLPMLSALQDHFTLHIITNGFKETQHIKLEKSGLLSFFDQVITSDEVQAHKPDAKIFVEALRRSGATRKNALMIGDNLMVDVLGARQVGMDQVYYNPAGHRHHQRVSYEISHLRELPPIVLASSSPVQSHS